jgi:hypothetical protein
MSLPSVPWFIYNPVVFASLRPTGTDMEQRLSEKGAGHATGNLVPLLAAPRTLLILVVDDSSPCAV